MRTFSLILSCTAAILSSSYFVRVCLVVSSLIGVALFLMPSTGLTPYFAVMFEVGTTASASFSINLLAMRISISTTCFKILFRMLFLMKTFQLSNMLTVGFHILASYLTVKFWIGSTFLAFLSIHAPLTPRLVTIPNRQTQKSSRMKLAQRLPLIAFRIRANFASDTVTVFNCHSALS